MEIFVLIIKIILFLILSELIYSLNLKLKRNNIPNQNLYPNSVRFFNSLHHFKEKSKDSLLLDPILSKIMPYMAILFSLVALSLFPILNSSIEYKIYFGPEFIIIILIFLMLINLFMVIISQHPNRIQNSKEIISKMVNYLLPIILALIAIKITLTRNNVTVFSFYTIIDYQNNAILTIFGYTLPSIFLFMNPFSFIAFISSIIGLNRETNLDALPKESIRAWNFMEEIHGTSRGLFELSKSISFFILISFLFPIYLGNLWYGENGFVNILIIIALDLIVIYIISIIGKGKPRIFLDRKILNFIRTPFLFAVLSILWAFL